MGVRCTLLGHKYGEAEIEREREERGEEAVVTIREVQTCQRCGTRSVVSENKEVTAAERGDADVATPDDADAAPTSEPRPDEPESGDPVADASVDGARSEATAPDTDPAGADAPDAAPDSPAEQGPEHDPETDDGVILEDEEVPPEDREYGEWPDAEEDHASAEADPAAGDDGAPEPWPDSDEDADEGLDAAPPDDEPADVEYPGSADAEPATAEEAGTGDDATDASSDDAELLDADEPAGDGASDGASAHPDEDRPADEGADFERAREASSPSGPSTGGTELYCPACGYRDPSHDGSLREGDICPECRKGYLAAGE